MDRSGEMLVLPLEAELPPNAIVRVNQPGSLVRAHASLVLPPCSLTTGHPPVHCVCLVIVQASFPRCASKTSVSTVSASNAAAAVHLALLGLQSSLKPRNHIPRLARGWGRHNWMCVARLHSAGGWVALAVNCGLMIPQVAVSTAGTAIHVLADAAGQELLSLPLPPTMARCGNLAPLMMGSHGVVWKHPST